MTKSIWICPDNEQLMEEMFISKDWFNKDVIIIHSSNKTIDFPFQQNIRLQGETLQLKVKNLEDYLEQLGNTGERICIVVDQSHKSLTDSALFFMMAHFPLQTGIETSLEKWINFDVNWKNEEVYHIAHHFLSQNKFSSAEILLNTYVKDKNINHLLSFGKNLLNGNVTYPNENNREMYFNLLITVLEQLVEEDEEEIKYVYKMKGLEQGEQTAFIFFLQNYCKHLYDNEDLVNFIVLFYRLAEELLLFAMGWDVNKYNQFSVQKNSKRSVPFHKPTSRHFRSYLEVLKLQLKRFPKNEYIKEVYKDFSQDWLINFLELRHEGVSGHGFMEYNIELFQEICGMKPLEKLNELLQKYNVKAKYDLFEIVQKASLAIIRNELVKESTIV